MQCTTSLGQVYESFYRVSCESYRSYHHNIHARCLLAVGKARDPQLLKDTLEWALGFKTQGEAKVRLQDAYLVTSSVGSSLLGRDIAWVYLTEHWDVFMARFAKAGFLIGHVMRSVIGGTLLDRVDAIEAFLQAHPCPPAARAISQSIEAVRADAARVAREGPQLQQWFDARSANS
jgi:hypothetical protein